MSTSLLPGTAAVKPQYLLSFATAAAPDDDSAEGSTYTHTNERSRSNANKPDGEIRTSRKKLTREEKKAQRGQNKGRRFGKVRDELDLCWKVASGRLCEFGDTCRFTHDIATYLAAKPRDLLYNPSAVLTNAPPFVNHSVDGAITAEDVKYPCLDLSTSCPIFAEAGECRYGLKCRFLGGHVYTDDKGELVFLVDEHKKAQTAVSCSEANFASPETLKLLRSRKYSTPISASFLKEVLAMGDDWDPKGTPESALTRRTVTTSITADASKGNNIEETTEISPDAIDLIAMRTGSQLSEVDSPDIPVRFAEKKRLDWTGKTYLAPLTTVGNLPFRRLCVTYGADITCGEMGLATSFLAGSKEEWSLVRRHPSESTFGVQIAGNKPTTLVPTAEVIAKECAGNIDFVDINCGCPIDLVFKTGSGSALLDAPGKLGKIIVGMNRALGEIPVTVKLRTGIKDGKNIAHRIMPRLAAEWNTGCISIHGRTRQQRYTKLADWDYIKQCVDAVRAREADEDLPPVPIFGGGDCFSSEDYWTRIETSGVDGVMIGRGALIKPWIFTEIKERREWDISPVERLEGIRKYAEYGLSHFGSDTTGINTTRRYLCEALSFQYRYIPIGLLERLPARINDRAPAFRGRNELETLLASADSQDWVRISEMFLGPSPESWTFTPKHKSNAYGAEESQG